MLPVHNATSLTSFRAGTLHYLTISKHFIHFHKFYQYVSQPLFNESLSSIVHSLLSNPVFTAILAWIFLKERCTFWDCVFTVFALTGVVLIARPPFLFGDGVPGIEGNYTNHIKGTISAFAGDIINTQ